MVARAARIRGSAVSSRNVAEPSAKENAVDPGWTPPNCPVGPRIGFAPGESSMPRRVLDPPRSQGPRSVAVSPKSKVVLRPSVILSNGVSPLYRQQPARIGTGGPRDSVAAPG